jgi:hypothetical protein
MTVRGQPKGCPDRTRLIGQLRSTTFQPSTLSIVWRAELICTHMPSVAMEWQSTTACSCYRANTMQCLTRLWIVSVIGFLVLAGCTTTTPPPATERPEPRIRNPAVVDSSMIANIHTTAFTPGRLQYDFQTSSITRALAGDSTHRADSAHVIGILTATLTAGPSRNTVVARIEADSISVTTGSGTSVPVSSSELFVFTIDTRSGRVAPANKEATQDCTKRGVDSSPLYGREVLPSIHIPAVQMWTDTAHTSTCRGGVLLAITRIASYTRLPSPDSIPQLLRSTQFQINGNGRQWDQKIEVSGDGISTDTLRLSGSPLRLREVTGSSQTKLLFRTQLRVQEFIQTSTAHIALRS